MFITKSNVKLMCTQTCVHRPPLGIQNNSYFKAQLTILDIEPALVKTLKKQKLLPIFDSKRPPKI